MATSEQITQIINLLGITNTCLVIIIFFGCVVALLWLYHYILKTILL